MHALDLAIFVLSASEMTAGEILPRLKEEEFLKRFDSFNIPKELFERVVWRLENIAGKHGGTKGWS